MRISRSSAALFARIALAAAFLSAVADRLGQWGQYGMPGVAWGNFARFTAYTRKLTWMMPESSAPMLAWAATVAEVVLALGLLAGWHTRLMAALSGVLLLIFALAMTAALGIKAPLDSSVFSASAAAFLLACAEQTGFGLDHMRRS